MTEKGKASSERSSAKSLLTLEELDLLIRSASSLLHIIRDQPDEPREEVSGEARFVKLLDRFALLLIKDEKMEVASVFARQTTNILEFVTTEQESSSTAAGMVNTSDMCTPTSNSKKDAVDREAPPPLLFAVSEKEEAAFAPKTWLKYFLKKGPYSSVNQGVMLERRANEYLRADTKSKVLIRQDLLHFVLIQSAPKISQRLNLNLHGLTKSKFLSLFSNKSLANTLEQQFKEISVDSERYKLPERLLDKVWKRKLGLDVSFSYDQWDQIVLTGKSIGAFHNCISAVINGFNKSIQSLIQFRSPQHNKHLSWDKALSSVRTTLEQAEFYISILSDLVNKGATFEKYINQPALHELLRHPHDLPNKPYNTDDARSIVEDEGIFPHRKVNEDPAGAIKSWIGLSVQHIEAVTDVTKHIRVPVKLNVCQPVKTFQARSQASLDELLCKALEERNVGVDFVKASLIALAKDKAQKREDEFSSNWSKLSDERWDDWDASFAGKHHCESVGVCLKSCDPKKLKMPSEHKSEFLEVVAQFQKVGSVLGVSKLCCCVCHLYISTISDNIKMRGTSGKTYPWAPPPWEYRRDVLETIWEHLKKMIWDAFVVLRIVGYDRRNSVKDDGQSDLNIKLYSLGLDDEEAVEDE